MAKIPLTIRNFKGQYTQVDDSDYEWLSQWNWFCSDTGYAVRKGRKSEGFLYGKNIRMHRQILGVVDPKLEVDHINHNSLDNRRSNLRFCTSIQNQGNSLLRKDSTSDYKGVSWNKPANKWCVQIRINKCKTYLGLFSTKQEAALAYNEAAKKHFGEFALLNCV